MLTTVAEMPEFLRRSRDLFSESERKSLVDYLAAHPKAGDLLEGTGGIRKLRWARGGRGKSGGARVIYYFHDYHLPLYLLTVFSKNERANLSLAERHQLAKLVALLVRSYWENEHV